MSRGLLWSRGRPPSPGMPAVSGAAGSADADESPYRPIDWALLRRLLGLLTTRKGRYALGGGLGVGMVILEMLSPQFMRRIIDVSTRAAENEALRSGAVKTILLIVAVWAMVWAAALLLQRAAILVLTDAGERVQFDLRRALFDHLQRLSMSYYDRTKLGRIISRCTSDVSSLRELNVWGVDIVCRNVVMMVVAAAMLLATDARLFLSVAWLGPILYFCNRIYRKKAAVAHQIAREGYTRVAANLAENISGARVVTAFHRQDRNLDIFNVLQQANTENNVRAARVNGFFQPLLHVIGFVGRLTILLYGGYLITQQRMAGGVGSVVAAFLYWDWFMNPILTLGNFHNQLLMALASAERIFDLLDARPEVFDLPNAKPLPRIRGHVRFEGVTFGYAADRPVLHDIDFDIPVGQCVALVGATGSGKTTIVSLIARFYQPQQGRVLVDGIDIRHVTGESLHHQMGLVLQNNFLFSGSVLDNIRYARPAATQEEVIEAARNIGSLDIIMNLPEGLLTSVGERGANLSLGQRQLISFTRSFLADPRIFLLDEATSSVDTATERVVQRSLDRLLVGRTTFIVAHRLSTIVRADRILVLDRGRIVEQGTHRELIRLGGKYAKLYEEFVGAREGEATTAEPGR